jgi:hypothetical protein
LTACGCYHRGAFEGASPRILSRGRSAAQ